MDSALSLKIQHHQGQAFTHEQALALLHASPLVQQLLQPVPAQFYPLLYRLTQLAEIPFAYLLEQAQTWLQQLVDLAACPHGFSPKGTDKDLLACYNAMVATVCIKFKSPATSQVHSAINWIMQYQSTSRGQLCQWQEPGIQKYGGCMKGTPCYIGVVKSMVALSAFLKAGGTHPAHSAKAIEHKLTQGLAYLQDHQLFLRKSAPQPITNDIAKLVYPFTYKVTVLEVLRLMQENGLQHNPACQAARQWLLKKQKKAGYWQVNKVPIPTGWVPFDAPGQAARWLTFEINKALGLALT